MTREERAAQILEHLPQVRLIARRIHQRLPVCVELDDLEQIGAIGLIAAVDRYDPASGVALKTYAEYKIRGAILDGLRHIDHLSRNMRRSAKDMAAATEVLAHRLGRAPTDDEVAEELGLNLEEFRRRQASVSGQESLLSLDYETSDGMRASGRVESPQPSPEQTVNAREEAALVARALERLTQREREVIEMAFWQGRKLREIGSQLGLHESRISQVKKAALERLRRTIDPRKLAA